MAYASTVGALADPERSLDVPPASELCWFCSERPKVNVRTVVVDMHFAVQDRNRYCTGNLYVSHRTMVPRCGTCAGRHQRAYALFLVLSLLLGVLVGCLTGRHLGGPSPEAVSAGILLGGFAALAACPIFAWVIRPLGIRSRRDFLRIPEIRDLLATGWRLGAAPGPCDGPP